MKILFKTPIKNKDSNPTFGETCVLNNNADGVQILLVSCFNSGKFKNTLVGSHQIQFEDYRKKTQKWFPLSDKKFQYVGDIELEIAYRGNTDYVCKTCSETIAPLEKRYNCKKCGDLCQSCFAQRHERTHELLFFPQSEVLTNVISFKAAPARKSRNDTSGSGDSSSGSSSSGSGEGGSGSGGGGGGVGAGGAGAVLRTTMMMNAFLQNIDKITRAPPPNLPAQWEVSEQERTQRKKRWAVFAAFMSRPYTYASMYRDSLQQLDAFGCINLKRITRREWPVCIGVAHTVLLFYCPYEGLQEELSVAANGVDVVFDAVQIASSYVKKGYRVVYIQDPTVKEVTQWFDFFLQEVEKDIIVHFIGYGRKVLNRNLHEQKKIQVQSCLLLYNENRKKGTKHPPPESAIGITEDTLSEEYLFDRIASVQRPEIRVTLYFDIYRSAAVFTPDPPDILSVLRQAMHVAMFTSPLPLTSPSNASPTTTTSSSSTSSSSSSSPSSSSLSPTRPSGPNNRLIPPGNTVLIESNLNVDAVLSLPDESAAEAAADAAADAAAAAPENRHVVTSPSPLDLMKTVRIDTSLDISVFDKLCSPSSAASSSSSSSSSTSSSSSSCSSPSMLEKSLSGFSSALTSSIACPVRERGFISSLASFINLIRSKIVRGLGYVVALIPDCINPFEPFDTTLDPAEAETSLSDVFSSLASQGTSAASITSMPGPGLSPVEKAAAEERWQTFTREMKKPAAYTSKYKDLLIVLDEMGAINLNRITRAQIPKIRIDRCISLFFCPYEDLDCTLDEGPINDATVMAKLFMERGYRVVYFCDASPKEYYMWMDWLLDNVYYEIVSFFAGHGTQVRDFSGREKDGMSEVMVFFEESKKADNQGEMITARKGITERTVSDDLMFDLITSKQYPETRIVLISDCCHSGTLFNFDQSIPSHLTKNKPPLNVVCIGSARDDQTAKQTKLGGTELGVFTHRFNELLRRNQKTTFKELEKYMKKEIKNYQEIVLTTSSKKLLDRPIIADA